MKEETQSAASTGVKQTTPNEGMYSREQILRCWDEAILSFSKSIGNDVSEEEAESPIFKNAKDFLASLHHPSNKAEHPTEGKNIKYFIEDRRNGKWLKIPQNFDDTMIDTSRSSEDEENRKWTNDPSIAMKWDTFDEAEIHNKKYWNMVDIEVTEHEFIDNTKLEDCQSSTPPSANKAEVKEVYVPVCELLDWIKKEEETCLKLNDAGGLVMLRFVKDKIAELRTIDGSVGNKIVWI